MAGSLTAPIGPRPATPTVTQLEVDNGTPAVDRIDLHVSGAGCAGQPVAAEVATALRWCAPWVAVAVTPDAAVRAWSVIRPPDG